MRLFRRAGTSGTMQCAVPASSDGSGSGSSLVPPCTLQLKVGDGDGEEDDLNRLPARGTVSRVRKQSPQEIQEWTYSKIIHTRL